MFEPGNIAQRIDAVVHTALMHMPRKDWHLSVLSFDGQRLAQLRQAMTAWANARSLSHAAFEANLVDPTTSDAAIGRLRAAADDVRTAATHQDLADASGKLAAGMQSVGLNKWPGFLKDAAARAQAYQPALSPIVLAQVAAPGNVAGATPEAVPGGQNADRTMSAAGQAALAQREGQKPGYYNDSANNCTYGIGILEHLGPCTSDELSRSVDPGQAQAEFQRRMAKAARRVREQVQDRRLTQNQFDALVFATYNTRYQDNGAVLDSANRGDDGAVSRQLGELVHTHDHDGRGKAVGPPRRSRGLVRRFHGSAPITLLRRSCRSIDG